MSKTTIEITKESKNVLAKTKVKLGEKSYSDTIIRLTKIAEIGNDEIKLLESLKEKYNLDSVGDVVKRMILLLKENKIKLYDKKEKS